MEEQLAVGRCRLVVLVRHLHAHRPAAFARLDPPERRKQIDLPFFRQLPSLNHEQTMLGERVAKSCARRNVEGRVRVQVETDTEWTVEGGRLHCVLPGGRT